MEIDGHEQEASVSLRQPLTQLGWGSMRQDTRGLSLESMLILELRKGETLSPKFIVWWVGGGEEGSQLGSLDPETSMDQTGRL